VSDNAPPFFVVDPDGECRKITGFNTSTLVFTIAPALSSAPSAADEMAVYQGFKRLPNLNDIESDDEAGNDQGWDRYFHLMPDPAPAMSWYGDGYHLFKTELQLRIRMEKHGRLHDWTAAALTNLSIMRAVLPRQSLYPSNVKALFASAEQAPEIVKDDDHKIVIMDPYTLIYRVDGTYA
jgi:hypothetical protein